MKIRIVMTVAVDPDDWNDTYGTGNDAATVRDEVRRYAYNSISHHPDELIEVSEVA